MRQSESTRVHTAHHSSQPDSDQTPSTPSRLLEQDTNTHEITHNCTGTCWLTSLCRHKHLHGGVKSLHRRGWGFGFPVASLSLTKWGYSVNCVRRYGSWNISAASITSTIWKHAGGEIKSVLEHRGLAVFCSVSWNFWSTCRGRNTLTACLLLFRTACSPISSPELINLESNR